MVGDAPSHFLLSHKIKVMSHTGIMGHICMRQGRITSLTVSVSTVWAATDWHCYKVFLFADATVKKRHSHVSRKECSRVFYGFYTSVVTVTRVHCVSWITKEVYIRRHSQPQWWILKYYNKKPCCIIILHAVELQTCKFAFHLNWFHCVAL